MTSTYSAGIGRLQLMTDGEQSGVWGQITNANLQTIEEMTSGLVTHDVAGSATTTLGGDSNVGSSYSATESKAAIVKFTGTKTGSHDVVIPAREGWWIFWDASSGAYDLTVKVSGGSGVVVPRGEKSIVFSDGTTGAPELMTVNNSHWSGTDLAVANGGTGASSASAALTNLGLTATAAELNILDGVTSTTAELNYTDGVTSAIQTQINATTTTAGAALPKAGGTMTGDTICNDNVSMFFGTGSDLEIMHDGAHSNITDAGTGDLRIRADNLKLSRSSDAEKYIYCTTDGGVQIYHNGSEKLVTTSTGVSVTGKLRVTSNVGLDDGDHIAWTDNSHTAIVVNGGERVRIEADGDLHADGDVIAYSTTISDERLKENIQPIEDALSKVNQLKGCTFTYTADGKESAGLIAQDVEKVLPSAVSEKKLPLKIDDGKAYKVLQYDQTIGLLVEAIKELTAKVEALEGK